jgi:hypothetical protein
MKRNNRKKENQEIEPLPKILPVRPSTPATRPPAPEITPLPEKGEPYRSIPEVLPKENTQTMSGKKHKKKH